MIASPKITILAGGDSTRMGRDKATISYGGDPWLVRIARRASAVADRVCVAGREQPENWPFPNIPFLPDRHPDRGPIEGLQCALLHDHSSTVLVACDMPLLSTDALEWLLSTHRNWKKGDPSAADNHGLVVRRNDAIEPLFSVYHPSVLDLLQQRIAEERYSLRGLIEVGEFAYRTIPETFSDQLRNVNTPEDLEQLPS